MRVVDLMGKAFPNIIVSGDISVAVDTELLSDNCTFHNLSFHLSLEEFEVVVDRRAYLMSLIWDSTLPLVWPLLGRPVTCSIMFVSQNFLKSPSVMPFSLSCLTV